MTSPHRRSYQKHIAARNWEETRYSQDEPVDATLLCYGAKTVITGYGDSQNLTLPTTTSTALEIYLC